MKIYSLYSKSQKRYNLPFFAEDDDAAIAYVTRMVSSQGDPALMASLDDLEINLVGIYDPKADILKDEFPVDVSADGVCMVLCDLHKTLPLPPMVKAAVDKFYSGGKSNG